MKNRFLLLLLPFTLLSCSKEDSPKPEVKVEDKVHVGNVTLDTQAELNTFGQNKYTLIKGDVWIEGASISDLSAINNLRKIEGSLYVLHLQVESLSAFTGLDTVTVDLNIGYLPHIQDLRGLDNLVYVGNNFNLESNDNLQNLEGLGEVEKLVTFYINENKSLKSLSGFESIGKVTYYGAVYNNPVLSNFCALQNILQNLEAPEVEWTISGNAYNPNQEEIALGNCKK